VRVLIAGAGGTIGLPLVRELLAEGHDVAGLTRSKKGAARVAGAGGKPIVADALAHEQLAGVVAEQHPEAVFNLLTALPMRGPTRASQMHTTNRLRTEGTANLLAAAKGAGVRRLVAQSVAFAYGFTNFGRRILDETSPPAIEAPSKAMRTAQQAALSLEQQTLEASSRGELAGVILRLGTLYGPGVPSSEFMVMLLKRRLMALPGGGHSLLPWVTLSDAVRAIAIALTSTSVGEVYNIVDGEPVSVREFLTEISRVFETPEPYSMPYRAGRLLMPFGAPLLDRTLLRLTNKKASSELGWVPEYRCYRDGILHWAQVASMVGQAPRPENGHS
jgi:nucleoside-diphosphate-sugar epimerase